MHEALGSIINTAPSPALERRHVTKAHIEVYFLKSTLLDCEEELSWPCSLLCDFGMEFAFT